MSVAKIDNDHKLEDKVIVDSGPTLSLSRRQLIQRAAAFGGGLLAAGTTMLSVGCADSLSSEQKSNTATHINRRSLAYKGINYDVGTNEGRDIPSARLRHSESMRRDIHAIRHDLHCNSIGIHGTDVGRLLACSVEALKNGLYVWLQPRLFDSTSDEMLSYLAEVAIAAETLRKEHPAINLNVGCEMSFFTSGFIPGDTYLERIANVPSLPPEGWPAILVNLREHVSNACAVARSKFNGLLTYGAGSWEDVDWSEFDFVGLDYYMDANNEETYVENLRKYRRFNKPIIILEFGCCTFEGAEKAGGMGWEAVDYNKPVPEVKDGIVRSEQVQADYIGRLLDIFEGERDIEGAFVYQFVSPDLLHSPDPRYDLDMASYGVVKVVSKDQVSGDYVWEPKLAFHELARRCAASG